MLSLDALLKCAVRAIKIYIANLNFKVLETRHEVCWFYHCFAGFEILVHIMNTYYSFRESWNVGRKN